MADRLDLLPERLNSTTVGPSLKDLRRMSDVTQRAIGARLQASPETVRRWECARSPMNTDQLVRYASALGLCVVLMDADEYDAVYGDRDRQRAQRMALRDKAKLAGNK